MRRKRDENLLAYLKILPTSLMSCFFHEIFHVFLVYRRSSSRYWPQVCPNREFLNGFMAVTKPTELTAIPDQTNRWRADENFKEISSSLYITLHRPSFGLPSFHFARVQLFDRSTKSVLPKKAWYCKKMSGEREREREIVPQCHRDIEKPHNDAISRTKPS